MRTPPLGPRRQPPSVPASWQRLSWPLRILRAFLGITFIYAGVQKFSDPGFLHSGTPEFIGAQLQGFARGSPIAGLLSLLARFPTISGVGIAVLELAIGLGTLLGVAPISFAAAGLLVNTALFLSATWHVHPYFLGSDSIYAVAWAAYLVGAIEDERRRRREPLRGTRHQRAAVGASVIGRREFLRAGMIGAGTLFLGGSAAALAGGAPAGASRAGVLTRPGRSSPPGTTSAGNGAVGGTPVAKLADLPVGGAVGFTDPADGTPAVLLRLSKNQLSAFSRVCTHAGCLVQYDQADRLLVCPCHGAEFDPAHGAQPVAGPAPSPLSRIRVAVDRSTGTVVVPR
ncbi:MAG TPA: Rieske 2Fe-2S domain-containing protein [Actinomycetota bacterium]